MTAAAIVRMCRAAPFEQFAIHLVDGRQITIRHPEMIILSGGGRIATVSIADELTEVIDVLMIVSLRQNPADTP